MNPYDDEALKQEVIYLHSLWHQGPPSRNPNPPLIQIPNSIPDIYPNPRPNYIPPSVLNITSRGPIRNQSGPRNRNPRNHNHHHPYRNQPKPDPKSRNGPEWPVKPPPSPPPQSGWPQFKPASGRVAVSVLAEEKSNASVNKAQQEALSVCRGFLTGLDSDGENDETKEEDADEGDEDYLLERDAYAPEESEEFEFFKKLFSENGSLREHYERNHANGIFCCLVCGGIGEKIGRKFKNCLGLVQHSTAISKTKMRGAHRAYAQVVCNVLNWDIKKASQGNLRETSSSLREGGVENPKSEVGEEGGADCQNVIQGSEQAKKWPSPWPLEPQKPLETHVLSTEEQERLTTVKLQRRVVECCRDFFSGTLGSESDEEAREEEDSEHSSEEDASEECEEFKFLLSVFVENSDLRSYYEKNHENGDFVCLICASIGKKVWRRFRGCSGVLQHSMTLLNTEKKRAHRAYARVVCKVLGWNFDRFPIIVVKGDPLSRILATSDQPQVGHETEHDGVSNVEGGRASKDDSNLHQENGT